MAKYFYVYEIAGSPADRMVKMFNTESVIDGKKGTYIAEKKVAYKDFAGVHQRYQSGRLPVES